MNDDEKPVFTAERLSEALSELGQLAHDAGCVIDVAIYGGSCLTLVSNFRVATADVDAVAAADQSFLDKAAQAVAARRGWPSATRARNDSPPLSEAKQSRGMEKQY
jgi:hypothetical protein